MFLGLCVESEPASSKSSVWTGFACPASDRNAGSLPPVSVGVMWGAWHFLAILWGSADAFGSVPIPVYLLVAVSFLPPYRVLMAWVYDRTQSVLIAVLMHASLTASMVILGPPVSAGSASPCARPQVRGALWVVVAGCAALDPRDLRAEQVGDGRGSERVMVRSMDLRPSLVCRARSVARARTVAK